MIFSKTDIEGLVVIDTKKYADERGYFFESYQHQKFYEFIGKEIKFVQENESMSSLHVIRGLHFQKPPFAQGKLVRVSFGKVIDVVVDIRTNSSTYGKTFSLELSQENGKQLWIPEGFAHGFVCLEQNSLLNYKCTNYYNQLSEDAIAWNSIDLDINWGVESPIVSDKDQIAKDFSTFVSPF
jgi:dTDP-4-dehydrorhamnose 3,5-epimerase